MPTIHRTNNPSSMLFTYCICRKLGAHSSQKLCACKDAAVPKPSIKYTNGELLIIFHFSKEYQNIVSNPHEKYIVENEKNIVENIIEKLPETQSQIVRIILATPSVTTKEIADTLSIAQRNVQNHIRKLKEIGVIRRVGPDKGGHWEVILGE